MRYQVVGRPLDCSLSAESVFHALFGASENAFWLDSSTGDGFSYMGDASGPFARVLTYDASEHDGFFDWLRADLEQLDVCLPDLPFDFALGWVGALGYELKCETGGELRHHAETPDAWMLFADRAIAFNHNTRTCYALALASADDDTIALAWIDDVAARLRESPRLTTPRAPVVERIGPLRSRHDRDAYTQLIGACLEEINAGESYEICLTNMLEADGALDPWPAYRFLRHAHPVPFGAYLRCGAFSVLCSSPERMLRVDRDGRIESKPIKGTRPRGRTPTEDEALREELSTDAKERAENLMIVDLVRNDLGRCAEVGTVQVERPFDVESYTSVHQLVTTVTAQLRADAHVTDCVRAVFPAGSMTGAPKIRTMQILDELEAGARGIYSGSIGYFSLTGAIDLNVVIRTVVVLPNALRYGTGGAITALSEPGAEFEETIVKASPLFSLLTAQVQSPNPSMTPS